MGDAFVKPDVEIEADLSLLEPLVDEATIFVTYAPSLGSLDLCYDEHVGSHAVAEFLRRKPVLAHIHGHITTSLDAMATSSTWCLPVFAVQC